jgi:glucose-6-phosphate 1-dehydrogenase
MTFCYRDTFQQDLPDAYTAVLEAVAQGDHSVAVRMDSICAAWRLIEELKVPSLPVHRYQPGTWGPSVADELMAKRDSDWIVTDHKVCNGVTLHS